MRSIMHQKEEHTCYLCILLNTDYSEKFTQEHHVMFGRANRRLSEKYGLKVYLCLHHHEEGPEAVHKNRNNNMILRCNAQEVFERKYPSLSFRDIFGINYIDEHRKPTEEAVLKGFLPLEKKLEGIDWEDT